MSVVLKLSFVALAVTAGAVFAFLMIHFPFEHADKAHIPAKVEECKPAPAPAFGPVPHVTVQVLPTPTPTPMPTPAPAVVAPPDPLKVIKRKPTAAKKLRHKWAAPKDEPFSLEKLFNVR